MTAHSPGLPNDPLGEFNKPSCWGNPDQECHCPASFLWAGFERNEFGSLVGSPEFTGTWLIADADSLVSQLSRLRSVVGTTTNPAATMRCTGTYGTASLTGEQIELEPGTIGIRFSPATVDALVAKPADGDNPGSLLLFNRSGEKVHEITAVSDTDETLLTAIAEGFPACPFPYQYAQRLVGKTTGQVQQQRWRDDVQLSSFWSRADQADHLDDILHDGGLARCTSFRRAGKTRASHVDVAHAVGLLSQLVELRLAVTVILTTEGAAQLVSGRIESVVEHNGVLTLRIGAAELRCERDKVAEAWLTRTNPHTGNSAVEFYDRTGRALFHITQLGPEHPDLYDRWYALTESLRPENH